MKIFGGILKTLILLAVLGFVAYKFLYFFPAFSFIAPCARPIPYNIGNFDEKFEITEEYFLDALRDAEAIWEKPYGKDLFTYAPEDETFEVLEVNLVYDYRQEASGKLEDLGITVKDTQASYDSLKAEFNALKKDYESRKRTFSTRVSAFNKRKAAYEKEVDYWNKQGGAPEDEFNRIEKKEEALEEEAKALDSMQAKINKMVEDINAMVVALNRLAGSLNLTVDRYNTINVSRGETFEEGVYEQEGLKRQINIYEFSNRDKLVRVLAHELGHALHIGHVADPKAIMYEFNQGNSMELAPADLAELKLKCESKF